MIKKETLNEAVSTAVAILVVVGMYIGGNLAGKYISDSKWQRDLLEKGYGEYDKKSGRWQLCEPEVVLLNRNTDAIKILNGGTVTINDYLKIVENDLKDAQNRIETQAKELIEQDLQLDKYKKSIKIPEKSVKNTEKSVKRPLEQFEPSVIVPTKNLSSLK